MTKFRKKPVVIEAIQFDGANVQPVCEWLAGMKLRAKANPTEVDGDLKIIFDTTVTPKTCSIKTLEGTMKAEVGDWIIRGVKGEYYPCKADIFAATYELADSQEK